MMSFIVSAAVVAVAAAEPRSLKLMSGFDAWKSQQNKAYATPEAEKKAAAAFAANDKFIQEHNAAGHSYEVGHNEFSDLTLEEFKEMYLSYENPHLRRTKNYVSFDAKAADKSVDWTTKGAVTDVKNQGQCGSCWAFSTTGSLEGAFVVAGNELTSLSEQMLVSCDHGGDMGCNGGLMDNAFKWVEGNGGICSEDDYPYTSGSGSSGQCKTKCNPVMTISGFSDVNPGDEDDLTKAVSGQPVSVAIEADQSGFQLYKRGVFDGNCGKQLDHGVLAVGYGTDGGKDYWKVKNSWGGSWGESGYIRMIRGQDQCGITQAASFPTGATPVSGSDDSADDKSDDKSDDTPASDDSTDDSSQDCHYEDPNVSGGCRDDETGPISIQGIDGSICAPACGFAKPCPTDACGGATATPQCALQDQSGDKFCALICSPDTLEWNLRAGDAQCGGAKASCKPIQGLGICTWDE
jgi:C1A family cysteine protease